MEGRVDPWAVVVRHGRWYLLCLAHAPGAAARPTGSTASGTVDALNVDVDSPVDLEPAAYLERHLRERLRPYETCVEFGNPIDVIAPFVGPPWVSSNPSTTPAACSTARPTTRRCTPASGSATIPHRFHVVGGSSSRQAVREVGDRMVSAATTDVAATGTR